MEETRVSTTLISIHAVCAEQCSLHRVAVRLGSGRDSSTQWGALTRRRASGAHAALSVRVQARTGGYRCTNPRLDDGCTPVRRQGAFAHSGET